MSRLEKGPLFQSGFFQGWLPDMQVRGIWILTFKVFEFFIRES
jgi:hypothetical protein